MLAGHAIVGSNLALARSAHGFGSDAIKIALIGCGRRGTAATIDMLNTSGGAIKLVAMADVFENNLHTAFRTINGKHGDKVDVSERRYAGLNGFQQVMQSDADVVILATPAAFRPMQFEAAVTANKHVFMEKPVATDAPGVRRMLAANEVAKEKGLAVAVGLQRRHEPRYQECIARLKDGAIGDPIFARAYWNGVAGGVKARQKNQSELEYQLRNWHRFAWLGGDLISEHHIHNLDVINWLMDGHPIDAQGQGGRTVHAETTAGETFDHHMIEFSYESGAKLLSQCRLIRGCWNKIGEHVHGTTGSAEISSGKILDRRGNVIWQSDTQETKGKGLQQEQQDWISALRQGDIPNELEYGAASTMTAILGRMASYSGKLIKWNDAINSDISLADVANLERLDSKAPVVPAEDGRYLLPVPGSKSQIV